MGLENDIHQQKFRSQNQKCAVNLIYTYHWMVEQLKEILASEDITMQQYNILRILRGSRSKPLSTLEIRNRMLDKMSDTSRIVDRLVVKGLVTKRLCETDRRLVDVVINDAGLQALEKLDKRNPEMDQIMLHLSTAELVQLNHLLDKLRGWHTD